MDEQEKEKRMRALFQRMNSEGFRHRDRNPDEKPMELTPESIEEFNKEMKEIWEECGYEVDDDEEE